MSLTLLARPDDSFPLSATARRRLSLMSIFSERAYLGHYPDVAQSGQDALIHALSRGYREGRDVFDPSAVARAYGLAARDLEEAGPPDMGLAAPTWDRARRVTLFCHSLSDLAVRDAAQALERDLRLARVSVALRDETADHLADHGVMVFIAPQDFFAIGAGPLWWDPEILKDGFVYNTASVDTLEGRGAIAAILNARGVVEPSAVWSRLWRQAGIDTLQFSPAVTLRSQWLDEADLSHPLILGAPPGAQCEPGILPAWLGRPVDLLHFDRDTERRNIFFGRNAARFAKHATYLYLQQGVIDFVEQRMHRRAHTRISGHLCKQARLTLCLAEDRYPCLDRYRVIHQAMAGGSVVVSDVAFVDPTLRAGTHYFHDDSKHLPSLIDWLLDEPDGHRAAERVRRAGFEFIAAINGDLHRRDRLAAFLTASRRSSDIARVR